MKQVTFELLRHGPPNNQLLSPLTDYLALCQNHPPTTLRVPFEHNQFMHRLQALSYSFDDVSRGFQVRDTATVLAELMGRVPGLVAELNRDPDRDEGVDAAGRRNGNRTTHLRMILSSSELALLPFELMLSPPGFPGAGQPLLLQFQDPICLTREVRRVSERTMTWPAKPRILFVSASPGAPSDTGPGSVPFAAHLKALQDVLDPWADRTRPAEHRLDDQLVVLRDASIDQIAKACAEHEFSHVHILAHGIEYREGFDIRFGLALHHPDDPTQPEPDRVSGDRLATALRPVQARGRRPLSRPLVVTMASCDSGKQGGVLEFGGSIAFALHQAEIPVVVGSQFPLSKESSVDFVRTLYPALLWGQDPRLALNDLRRYLHTRYPARHDWAGVMAYMALPTNFEAWLADVRRRQTIRSMEAAMKFSDTITERYTPDLTDVPPSPEGSRELLTAAERMDAGARRLLALYDEGQIDRAVVGGALAATEKRCAQAYFYFARSGQDGYARRWPTLLRAARLHYWEVFERDRAETWAVVQFLSLDQILRRLEADPGGPFLHSPQDYDDPVALWNLAHTLALNDLRATGPQRRAWGLGSLIELGVLGLLLPADRLALGRRQLTDMALRRTEDLLDEVGPDSLELYSTHRQIRRYHDWYRFVVNLTNEVTDLVSRILHILPAAAPARTD